MKRPWQLSATLLPGREEGGRDRRRSLSAQGEDQQGSLYVCRGDGETGEQSSKQWTSKLQGQMKISNNPSVRFQNV